MPLEIIRNDITAMHVDAIVNAANNRLSHGGGVCGAIHTAAGPQLLTECMTLHGCRTGEAKITKGYRLPARYVIHTVGPIWHGGSRRERDLLKSCYYNSLQLARQHGCASVAFPLISSGIFGYPRDKALKVATDTIRDFLLESDENAEMMVYIVVFDKASFQISSKVYAQISEYIDDHYAEKRSDHRRLQRYVKSAPLRDDVEFCAAKCSDLDDPVILPCMDSPLRPAGSLEDALGMIDESFSQMLIRKIDEKGLTDPDCYKHANIDRKLFSKIRNDRHYRPKKTTALAFAVSLRLSIEETKELLLKAGLALSPSDKFDIIVEYYIRMGKYDIFEINNALYTFDQPILGGRS